MLLVTIIQFIAVGFTITALVKNTLMLSPEQHGVTCNITSPYVPKKNITAEHLVVYWGWQTLEVRWDFEGLTDTQIWLKETYEKTYDYRCKGSSSNITMKPTPAPILHPKTPSPKPTKSPTIATMSPSLNNSIIIINNNANARILCEEEYDNENHDIPLPMGNTKYYPFEITNIYLDEYNNIQTNNNTTKEGCDDLQIVIETGKSYFSLLVCGLLFECIGLILLISPTCHLVNLKTRRLLKQIVIGLNTVSFMLLLMAFAIWFAYFSTNINQVIETEGVNSFSVCILGEPIFGDSIAYLLSGWLLIGLATMSTCYLSNRPKKWYRFLRQKRHFDFNNNNNNNYNQLQQQQQHKSNTSINQQYKNDTILEEDSQTDSSSSSCESNSEEENDEQNETNRLGTLINRTPSNNSDGYNEYESYMTAESNSFGNGVVMKGDTYPYTYSPN